MNIEATSKIGMCCACGDQMHSSKTIWANGMEWCPRCAEMAGVEDAEDGAEEPL